MAIISTVNPTAMTSWKAQSLEGLYTAVANRLSQLAVYDIDAELKAFVRMESDHVLAGYRYAEAGKAVFRLVRLEPGSQIKEDSWRSTIATGLVDANFQIYVDLPPPIGGFVGYNTLYGVQL